MKQPKHFYKLYTLLFAAIIIFDRLTKWLMLHAHKSYRITEWLTCDVQYNRGIAGGFFHSETPMVFMGLTILIFAFIIGLAIYAIVRWLNYYAIHGEVLVIAGGLSNVYDRFVHNGVIDFLSCSYAGWYFPTFNIADAAIVLGVALMLKEHSTNP